MKIKHIEETTLVDYPGKIACTFFLFGCNFRCGFCYNPSLVIKEETPDLDEEKALNFLEKRKNVLDGVCITGGEPLMTLEKEFLQKIKSLNYKIKIDTNGSFPEKLKELIDEKLVDYIAMDIKTTKNNYQSLTSSNILLEKIEKSIKLISEFSEYEFRTTLIESIHTEEKIKEMLEWLNSIINKKIKSYSLQGFENKGVFVNNDFKKEKNTSEIYLNKIKEIATPYCENITIRI